MLARVSRMWQLIFPTRPFASRPNEFSAFSNSRELMKNVRITNINPLEIVNIKLR